MLPKLIIHNAVSADGRIDGFTPDLELFYDAASAFQEDATLAGADTILASESQMQKENNEEEYVIKGKKDKRPFLVVPDSKGRIRFWHYLKRQPFWKEIIVLVSKTTPQGYLKYLKLTKTDYIVCGDKQVDLKSALQTLSKKYKIKKVRVDSGGTLNGILLRLGLVDEISLLIYPFFVGGTSNKSVFRAPDGNSKKLTKCLVPISSKQLKNGVNWLRYKVLGKCLG